MSDDKETKGGNGAPSTPPPPPPKAGPVGKGAVRGQGFNGAGQCYEWADTALCMVIDKAKGQPQQIAPGSGMLVQFDAALRYVTSRVSYQYVIVRMNCVAPFRVPANDKRPPGQEEA
ncbi:MAG TPA: hypothetical protein VJQ42_02110 [Rhodanobacteraceae bacterium]|nr:hypothetical protein [Rhodanobacteraceae bacterium]